MKTETKKKTNMKTETNNKTVDEDTDGEQADDQDEHKHKDADHEDEEGFAKYLGGALRPPEASLYTPGRKLEDLLGNLRVHPWRSSGSDGLNTTGVG